MKKAQGIRLKLLDVGNDAFQPDPRPEVARILRDLADKIEHGYADGIVHLRDYNGNTVGDANINMVDA